MFRSRGENLHSVYILCFLNVAFFFMQFEDMQKYQRLFCFEWHAVMAGQIWRIFTYQFVHVAGIGPFVFHPAVALFLDLVLLAVTGMAVEEEWGTFHFVMFYLVSNFATVGIGALLGVTIMGSFFITFSLLFVYASLFPEQTFYLIAIPIRVSWLAYMALGMLVVGVFYNTSLLAALGGAAISYGYFLLHRGQPEIKEPTRKFAAAAARPEPTPASTLSATKNIARYSAMKKALANGAQADIDRLIGMSERDIVRGVNICPPVDYKPENNDGYCVRCEGFAECSARHLRLNRPKAVVPPPDGAAPEITQ